MNEFYCQSKLCETNDVDLVLCRSLIYKNDINFVDSVEGTIMGF